MCLPDLNTKDWNSDYTNMFGLDIDIIVHRVLLIDVNLLSRN
jgi:hypothetical protein